MDRKEIAVELKHNGYNCCQAVLCAYKDELGSKQKITPDFPPENDGGRGASDDPSSSGVKATWVEACGIDDTTNTDAGSTKVSVMVKSNASKAPENLTVRYYFDMSEFSDISLVKSSILYDQVSTEAAPGKSHISDPKVWEKDKKIGYVELSWTDYNFVNCGKKVQFAVGFYYGAKWDPTNDPSYKDLKVFKEDAAFFATGNEVRNDGICLYSDGVLIGGIEPDGTVPAQQTQSIDTPGTETTAPVVTTTAKATQTTAKTTAGTSLRKRGDVDCSGEVDVSDAVLLARMTAEDPTAVITSDGKINADCDGKTGLTSGDVTAILRHIAKIEEFKD